jgi:DNA replication protein DnaC
MALEHITGAINAADMAAMWAKIEKLSGKPREVVQAEVEENYLDRAHRLAAENRREMSRKLSTIPAEFAGATLSTYESTSGNRRAIGAADRVIKSKFRAGLGLSGRPGVGKSHLAAVIANAAIDEGRMTIFTSVRGMLDAVKDSYNAAETRDEKDMTTIRMIRRYASVEVLILNDLGKEPLTRWSIEMLYAIFDDRWEQGRPVVITANLDWMTLAERYNASFPGLDPSTGQALMDRVAGMTSMPWYVISGDSRRWGAIE